MKQYKTGYLFFILLEFFLNSSTINASAAISSQHWEGLYLGEKMGATFAQFAPKTSTQAGPLLDPVLANLVNVVGRQNIDRTGFLAGIGGGYNWQLNSLLLGLETDISSLSVNGSTYSNAISYPNNNGQFVITSYGNHNWLVTARPRLGLIKSNWLFYVTGGPGLSLVQGDFIFSTNQGELESKKVSTVKPGYVIGTGLETKITHNLSLKGEYLFAHFNRMKASDMSHHLPAGQKFSNTVNLKSNMVTLGFNYYFNANSAFSPLPKFDSSVWETEVGTRIFLSSGLDGAPQPLLNTSNLGDQLASRLTFKNLSAISEEIFARLEHASGLLTKGYLGAGTITQGQLNDEDFPALAAYSNTLSNARGNLSYATIDIGYSFLKNVFGKMGIFGGYNYYAQNLRTYSCTQLAGDAVCVPTSLLHRFLGISEEDTYHSLRIGLSSQANLTEKLTLTSEAAYIPLVQMNGLDIHNARQLIGPEFSNQGDGSMLETTLNYQLDDSWGMGIGGRYWMWNMRNGNVLFDFLGQSETITEPARFNTERYGVFLQLKYHHSSPKNLNYQSSPPTWKGLFLGFDLGGAFGKSIWSNPFGSTIASPGFVNISGFGDKIKATGPLAGGNIFINGQKGRLVYGVGGSLLATNIRGENTLFSGIGGINGQTTANYLGTLVGKIGTTFNHSLLYINAGRAILNTQYRLNGNTGILTLGAENKTIQHWGWTSGLGIEYALSGNWLSSVEYDYVSIPSHTITFPSVELINTQLISAHQTLNIFKLGIKYKFNVQ